MMRQLANSLGGLGDSSAFAVPIPLTSKTLGDALDFAGTATRKLTDPLVIPGTDDPNFSTADELADRFAVALGLDPSYVDAGYDSASDELTFRLSFQESYSPGTAGVDLGIDLDPLGEFSFSSDFTLNASAGADFTFGIYLGDLAPGQSLADRFFIEDAKLAASISLAANNLAAAAKIGMLGVGINNGNAVLDAAASVELQNPLAGTSAATLAAVPDDFVGPLQASFFPTAGPTTKPNRLPLPSFASLLLNDPASLIAPRRLDNLMPGNSVNVSQLTASQTEPVIVIDPTDPQRQFVASNDFRGNGMIVSYSTDGGATWSSRRIATGPAGDKYEAGCCDPAATFDKFGNLYFAYLSQSKQVVTILLSRDGGQSFEATPVGEFRVPLGQTMTYDRPVLGSGPAGDPAGNDAAVWVAYFERPEVGLKVAGLRVAGPDRADIGAFGTPQLLAASTVNNFPDLAVGPKGQVAVISQTAGLDNGPSRLDVAIDPDGLGPQPFGPLIFVTDTGVGAKEKINPQPDRHITAAPSIAYALSGPNVGDLYVVYTEQPDPTNRPNDTDIVLKYSKKDGAANSWNSTPIAVSHAPVGSSQFFPSLAVDPKSGNIAVGWYDTRSDTTNNKKVEFWGALSNDGGKSFGAETKISTGQSDEANADNDPNNPSPEDHLTDIDFGDYTGLDFFNGELVAAWADNSAGGRFDIYTAKITLAPATPTPSTPLNLAAAASSFAAAATGS